MLTRDEMMPGCLARRAAEHPDRVFMREVGGGEVTHRQLHEAALGWAAALRRLGVTSGATVLTMLPTRIDTYATWLGIGWLRAVEVPVNTQYLGAMLEYVVNDSKARVIVIAARWLERLAAVADRCPNLETVIVPDDDGDPSVALPFRVLGREDVFEGVSPTSDLEPPDPWDLCAILYTSGTTGPSKGVLVPWAQLHRTAVGMAPLEDFDEHDVGYVPFPAYHVSGKSPVAFMLAAGGSCVVRDVFSTDEFMDDVRTYGCTFAMLIFTMAAWLHQQPERPDDAEIPLEKAMVVPPIPQVEELARRYGMRVRTVYNMTEVSNPIATQGWGIPDPKSCGQVQAGYQCRIVDEHDYEVPPGQVGELVVRADEPWVLNAGYYGMPDKTAEAWRNGWFHTGDGFTRDEEGNFFFVDRFKDTIRRRGENISSMEVEAIVNSLVEVAESAAVAVPSEHGEDEVKLVVVPAPGKDVDPEALVLELAARMPRFMIPRYVEVADALPKTPTAKVRKVELRQAGVTERTWDREAAGVRLPKG
ncbi:MAG: AMP-binding protein [Acidimicrobiia bacterium]|nr:AMP-binding protein [Acidimicrobiia bacterium]